MRTAFEAAFGRPPDAAASETIAASEPRQPEPVAGGRILVVDDNADAASTLAELLQMVGYEVRCAGDGEAALALLEDYVPELALLDIGLPGMDGYQLARLLRADPRMAKARLVALTGYGRDNDRARALEARFDEHLVKPVMADRLLEVLQRLMPPR